MLKYRKQPLTQGKRELAIGKRLLIREQKQRKIRFNT